MSRQAFDAPFYDEGACGQYLANRALAGGRRLPLLRHMYGAVDTLLGTGVNLAPVAYRDFVDQYA
ncbi:MAG: hypothetical protein JJ868_19450 [Shimia sp.]|nr:hypothetical protein [Shimia sp.]